MKCLAVVNIDGEHFECELEHPHEHWGHQNRASGAIWHSHAEHEQWNEYLKSKRDSIFSDELTTKQYVDKNIV